MVTTKTKPVSKAAKTPRKDAGHVKAAPKAQLKTKVSVHKESKNPEGLTASVLSVDGTVSGRVTLPVELFGANVNKELLAQSVRVYLANQREGSANTKTRGEVEGSTRKIYRQKGTGRARHGGIRAPIFVGGGIVFGPRSRDYHLSMPKVMKQKALASALTAKHQEKSVIILDGLEKLEPKTKAIASAFRAVGAEGSVLLAVPKESTALIKASRNIADTDVIFVTNIHPYDILTHAKLIMTKGALEEAKAHFLKN